MFNSKKNTAKVDYVFYYAATVPGSSNSVTYGMLEIGTHKPIENFSELMTIVNFVKEQKFTPEHELVITSVQRFPI